MAAEFDSPFGINSLSKLSEEEEMLREAVQRFAQEVVAPKVEAMEEKEQMDPEIIKGLFEQGLMSIETDPDLGGAGGSFTAAIIVIEGACSAVTACRMCLAALWLLTVRAYRLLQSWPRSTRLSQCFATSTT